MRAKHARRRAHRRVRQGRWTVDDLHQFADRRLFRSPGMRRSLRDLRGHGYEHPFMLLQHKYPWPTPLGEDFSFRTHSDMLHRRQTNLKKIHTMYRSRS